jgi:hypothetical protein
MLSVMLVTLFSQRFTPCAAAPPQTAVAAVEDGSTVASLQRSGSMPRSGSATTKPSASALRRSSTLPNDRRGSKVSFGAALQVQFLAACRSVGML